MCIDVLFLRASYLLALSLILLLPRAAPSLLPPLLLFFSHMHNAHRFYLIFLKSMYRRAHIMIVFFFLFFSFVLSANRKRNLAKKSFIGRYISINFLSLLVSSFLFGQCLDIRIHAHTLVQFILFPTRIKITDRRTAAERSSQIFFLIVEEREEEEKKEKKGKELE